MPEEDTAKAPIENDFKTEKFADVVAAAAPVLTEVVAEQEPLANVASGVFVIFDFTVLALTRVRIPLMVNLWNRVQNLGQFRILCIYKES